MRNKCVQMSLSDIYNDVSQSIEEHKPELIKLLEEHIDFADLIPPRPSSMLSTTITAEVISIILKALSEP